MEWHCQTAAPSCPAKTVIREPVCRIPAHVEAVKSDTRFCLLFGYDPVYFSGLLQARPITVKLLMNGPAMRGSLIMPA